MPYSALQWRRREIVRELIAKFGSCSAMMINCSWMSSSPFFLVNCEIGVCGDVVRGETFFCGPKRFLRWRRTRMMITKEKFRDRPSTQNLPSHVTCPTSAIVREIRTHDMALLGRHRSGVSATITPSKPSLAAATPKLTLHSSARPPFRLASMFERKDDQDTLTTYHASCGVMALTLGKLDGEYYCYFLSGVRCMF